MSGRKTWQYGVPRGNEVEPLTCSYCKTAFPSIDALRAHKAEKFKEEDQPGRTLVHFWCGVCDLDFRTCGGVDEHLRQNHPHKQDFRCPGCDKKFGTLSSFVKHIEFGECCQLDIEALQARFADKMKFARGLAKLDQASSYELPNIKMKDFSANLGLSSDDPAPWQEPSWQDGLSQLSAWDVVEQNAWGSSETVTWNGGSSSTAEQTQRLDNGQQIAVEHSHNVNRDTVDPNSPYFDPQKFWHDIYRKYMCPHKTCFKSFKNKAAFVEHLKFSAIHKPNGKMLSCPSCQSHFDTIHALTAHVESQSKKCEMRYSLNTNTMYRVFLDQLTWGMAEVTGVHEDFTQKFELREEFKEAYGPKKTSASTSGQIPVHGFSSGGNSARTGRSGLTEAALSKQQQENRKDSPHFMPSEWQHHGGRGSSGPSVALTAAALSRLQLQEKGGFPGSQNSGRRQQQQSQGPQQHRQQYQQERQQQQQPAQQRQQQQQQYQRADSWGRPSEPRQDNRSWLRGQLDAYGWDTWNRGPETLEQQQKNGANSQPSGWREQRSGGSSGWS
ncbi:hypothetical protein diail_4126 [Diaporthe ilicicola]|nr:hypothetical protein diail_4126 [Diaporthe ilicicola]